MLGVLQHGALGTQEVGHQLLHPKRHSEALRESIGRGGRDHTGHGAGEPVQAAAGGYEGSGEREEPGIGEVIGIQRRREAAAAAEPLIDESVRADGENTDEILRGGGGGEHVLRTGLPLLADANILQIIIN